jgi:hypothetical protein
MLPSEEREQLSIQHDRADEAERRKEDQLKPEQEQRQGETGQPYQCNTEPLPPLKVQVIGRFLALKDET